MIALTVFLGFLLLCSFGACWAFAWLANEKDKDLRAVRMQLRVMNIEREYCPGCQRRRRDEEQE